MIVAATGHRPPKIGGYEEKAPSPLREAIRQWGRAQLTALKPGMVISGMALGWDQDIAQIAIDLKIPLFAAIPFEGQEKMWPEKSKHFYRLLLSRAYQIHIVCPGGYAAWKMQKRNEYMVDMLPDPQDRLLAVWDGTPGGTGNCIEYAEKLGRRIIRLNPKKIRITP